MELKESIVQVNPYDQEVHEYKAYKALLDYIRTLPVDPASKLSLLPSGA